MIKANIAWSAKQIAKAVTKGSMVFDNAIQRGNVWNVVQQSLLIESLIHNYPVPPMYTVKTDIDAPTGCKKGSKVFDCFDGKQRCEAIRAFYHNEFALTGLSLPWYDWSGDEVDLNGMTYEELPEEAREAFESYTMTVYFFTDITDDELAEMMFRLNNGKVLSGIEKSRIKAKNLPAVIQLAKSDLFMKYMTDKARAGYQNEDVVIKTALQIYDEQFELSAKNIKESYENMAFDANTTEAMQALLDFTDSVLGYVAENGKKAVLKRAVKKTNLVNVIYFCHQLEIQGNKESIENIGKFLLWFFNNEPDSEQKTVYSDCSVNGTNHAWNVNGRINAMYDAYSEYKSEGSFEE